MTDPPIRVAVVDDDWSVRNAMRRLLTATDFDARVFASGREFLGAMRDWRPDCLIVDLKMPGMTGSELLGKVSERTRNLPVIFMTAFDKPELRAEYDALGAAAYLLKPVEEQDLLAAIRGALKLANGDFGDFVRDPELDQSPIEKPAPRRS